MDSCPKRMFVGIDHLYRETPKHGTKIYLRYRNLIIWITKSTVTTWMNMGLLNQFH